MKRVAHVLWRSHGGIRRHVHYLASHPPSGWTTAGVHGPRELADFFEGSPFHEVSMGDLLRFAPEVDVIHAHGLTAGLCAIRPMRPSVVTTLHVVVGSSGRTARSPLSRLLARVALARADALIAPSRAAARTVKGVSRVIPPAFAPLAAPTRSRADLRAELDASEDDVVVVCVARLDPDKRLGLFVRAVEASGAAGWVVGDGADHDRLANLTAGTRVKLLGHRTDVADILSAADVFALPSASESYGIAIAEAVAAGLPVVGTDTGAHSELVGDAGVLVSLSDEEGFASGVKQLVIDGAERARLGQLAKSRRRPDPSALVAELGAVYDELAPQPRTFGRSRA